MKHWSETREVFGRLAVLRRHGARAALCTVVRIEGSAYRREGAKLLVAEDGTVTGNISGGCLEQDAREVALQVIRAGTGEVRSWCSSSDEIAAWEIGLGCDGRIDVLIEPALEDRALELAWLDDRRAFAVAVVLPGPAGGRPAECGRRLVVTADSVEGDLGSVRLNAAVAARAESLLGSGDSAIHEIEGQSVFIEQLTPPPRLAIFGAGDDARALARFGAEVGFHVAVVDKRPALLTKDRFPLAAELLDIRQADTERRLPLDENCYAVVMGHSFFDDQDCVRRLLASDAPYIGVLGPRRRSERILQNLAAAKQFDEADRSRVYAPVGLDIATDGAEQVATSILAEIFAVRSRREAPFLRDRDVPIHADAR